MGRAGLTEWIDPLHVMEPGEVGIGAHDGGAELDGQSSEDGVAHQVAPQMHAPHQAAEDPPETWPGFGHPCRRGVEPLLDHLPGASRLQRPVGGPAIRISQERRMSSGRNHPRRSRPPPYAPDRPRPARRLASTGRQYGTQPKERLRARKSACVDGRGDCEVALRGRNADPW